jgi:hypothetical protein
VCVEKTRAFFESGVFAYFASNDASFNVKIVIVSPVYFLRERKTVGGARLSERTRFGRIDEAKRSSGGTRRHR